MNQQHDRIVALCEQLKLDRLGTEWPALAQDAANNQASFADNRRLINALYVGETDVNTGSPEVHGRPQFAKHSVHDGSKEEIAPVHPDFACGFLAAVPDGFCWSAPRSLTRTLGASSGAGFANHGLTCLAITS